MDRAGRVSGRIGQFLLSGPIRLECRMALFRVAADFLPDFMTILFLRFAIFHKVRVSPRLDLAGII